MNTIQVTPSEIALLHFQILHTSYRLFVCITYNTYIIMTHFTIQTKLVAAIAEYERAWNSRWLSKTSFILLMIGLRGKIGNMTGFESYYPEYSYFSPPEFGNF